MASSVTPEGYKDTILGVVPQEWNIRCLGDLLSRCTNGLTYNVSISNGIPVTRIETISTGEINYAKVGHIQNSVGYEDFRMQKGDILYSNINSLSQIGKVAYYNGKKEIYHGMNLLLLRANQCLNKQYLYYMLLTTYMRHMAQVIAKPAVNQASISTRDLKKIKIPVPPLPEQQKIAEVLSTWDNAIEKQSRLIEKLELRKKGLMQQLLTGKKRLPGFSSEWEEVKLWEIGTFFKGAGVPKDEISSSGAYKCLTYGDIYTKYNTQIKDVKCFISQETAKISKKIEYGDICFASSGETLKDIGKCAVFVDDNIGYAGGDIIIFRKNIKTNPILLAYILNSEYVNKQKYSVGQGHSVVHIYIHNLEKIKIKIPYIKEQSAITELLSYCDKEIKLAYQKLKILKQQKKGLMQVLLTGKKRIIQ